MHLAYIDYIWQLFRVRQETRCGVSAASDFPEVPEGDSHHPEAPMTGFDWLTNRDGIQNYWIENWYRYDTHPKCPDCCPKCRAPSPMFCDKRSNTCVARSRRVFPFATNPGTVPTREEFLEASELLALLPITPPRNRGIKFDHLPTDGRTLATANIDAARARALAPLQSARVQQSRSRGADSNEGSLPDSINKKEPSMDNSLSEFVGPTFKRRETTPTRTGRRKATAAPSKTRGGRTAGQSDAKSDDNIRSSSRIEISPYVRQGTRLSSPSRTTSRSESDRTRQASRERTRQGSGERARQASSERTRQGSGERTRQASSERTRHGSSDRTRQASSEITRQGSSEITRQGSSERTGQGSGDRRTFTRPRQSALPRRRMSGSASSRGVGRRRGGVGQMFRGRGAILRPDTASTGSSAAMRGAMVGAGF